MRLVFAGTPEVAVPSLRLLLESEHEVVAVVTRPDAPSGRGRALRPSPVAEVAAEAGIEVLKPPSARDEDFIARLTELAPDACPVVAYGALLPERILAIPRLGWVNLHFSVLPRWRGAAPVQRAIMAGDETIGTTCFRIVKELDAGDVIRMEEIPMPDETAGELLQRLADSGAPQLLESLEALEAGEVPVPQVAEGITYASKVTTETARLDFGQDARRVRDLVMGCSPDPGAWCDLDSQRFKIYRAAVAEPMDLAPGELAVTRKQVFVGCGGNTTLELTEVQAPGKRRMNAIDWARGGAAGKVLA